MALAQNLEDPKFEVVRIGNSFYRKLVVDENLKFKCEENRRYYEEDEIEEEGELDDQLVYEGDEWVFRMEMPAIFHKFIVGSRARNKQKLEMESGCKIVVPKREEMEDAVYLRARQKKQYIQLQGAHRAPLRKRGSKAAVHTFHLRAACIRRQVPAAGGWLQRGCCTAALRGHRCLDLYAIAENALHPLHVEVALTCPS
mmetsp:Transcript_18938/g.42752  ORF Transcript_18938/g.42752 Transcript_18938/m.42752 type:complete len:199 (+) Transcript_18938:51-647(+)